MQYNTKKMQKIDVIEELQKLKLSDYPTNEIVNLLKQMGPIAIMLTDYNHSKDIERAVNNTKDEPEFNSVSRISFKPSIYNHNFLRASTPNNTMFYGSVISEEFEGEEKKNARIVGASEVSTLMRSNEILEGTSIITFGKWRVTERISLATIIDPTKNYTNGYLNSLKEKYLKFIQNESEGIQQQTIKYLSYFASEFSKKVANGNNHDYLISALLTELMVNTRFDGVVYPSVQSDGYGLCVAIHPKAIGKLKLIKVLQSKILKTQDEKFETKFLISNEKNCLVEDGETEFKLEQIK